MSNTAASVVGEQFAADFLQQNSYKILARNWKIRTSEIDIICKRGDTVYCIEVRTRRDWSAVQLDSAIDKRKLIKMRRASLEWSSATRSDAPMLGSIEVTSSHWCHLAMHHTSCPFRIPLATFLELSSQSAVCENLNKCMKIGRVFIPLLIEH